MYDRHHGLLQAMFASSIPEIIELVGSRSKYSGELKREHGKRYHFDVSVASRAKATHSVARAFRSLLLRPPCPVWIARTLPDDVNSSPLQKLAQCRQMYCVIYSRTPVCPTGRSRADLAPESLGTSCWQVTLGQGRLYDYPERLARVRALPCVYTECPSS